MSLSKRLAIIAIFLNIPLLYLCPGIAGSGHYTGLRETLSYLLYFAPLAIFLFLIAGSVPNRETAISKTICRVGLAIFALSVAAIAYCWDFGHNGVYELFPDLQAADVRSVKIKLGTVANKDIYYVALDEEDKARFVTLAQQITCRNPYAGIRQTEAYRKECPSFIIAGNDGAYFHLIISPPYYVDTYERAYRAENEEICRQLADFYAEMHDKYYSADAASTGL